ncbi:MAG: hypothetical protein GF350_04780 [Chitinivibrionales bacterium]|nr:hypothetical protein [Chitinivibrionales bacterium]
MKKIDIETRIIYYDRDNGVIAPGALPANLQNDLAVPYFGVNDKKSSYPTMIKNNVVPNWNAPGVAVYSGGDSIETNIPVLVNGVLLYDGVDKSVTLGVVPPIAGANVIRFKLWVFQQFGTQTILYFVPGAPDKLRIRIRYDVLIVEVANIAGRCWYIQLPNDFENQILQFEISKGVGTINYVRINGTNYYPYATFASGVAAVGGSIGWDNSAPLQFFTDFAIWDVEIVGVSQWQGQPNGNLNAAWVDTVGVNNGTVNGIGPQTRNLP